MRLVNFQSGLIPDVGDMNALSTNAEAAFDALIRAISTSTDGKILFDSLPPTTAFTSPTFTSPTLTITVPQQQFAIAGSVQTVTETVNQVDLTGISSEWKMDVHLVAGRQDDSQTRNFNSVSDTGVIIQQQLVTPIYTDDVARVVFAVRTDLAQVQDPALLTSDLGSILLATVTFDGSSTVTVTPDNTYQFQLPSSVSVAQENMPGPVTATEDGLMTSAQLATLNTAVQDVQAASGAAYLTAAKTGTTVSLDLKTGDSIDVDDAGALVVNFLPTSGVNGAAETAARSDHRHLALEAGVVTQTFDITNSTSLLGTLTTQQNLASQTVNGKTITPTKITNALVYWGAEGSTKYIETGWSHKGDGTVGCRLIFTGETAFKVEVGSLGPVYLTAAAQAETGVSLETPTTGTIRVVVTATSDA
jgi:hypothetical protein